MSRFTAGGEIKEGQGTNFEWGSPAVLFNTANHAGTLINPLENEGSTGSIWDLPIDGLGSFYWAEKRFNWYGSADIGSSFPTDWNSFIGGPPSSKPVVNLHITGPNYDDALLYANCEYICQSQTAAGLTYNHYFNPDINWFAVDTYADPGWPVSSFLNWGDGELEEGIVGDHQLMFWGSAADVSTRTYKAWVYDKTNGFYAFTHTFSSDGLVSYPSPAVSRTYLDLYDALGAYGPATSIEAAKHTIERFYAFIGNTAILTPTGTPWESCYISGIWRPTRIPTDAEIMALYNYYIGLL